MTGSMITEITVSCANTVDDSCEEYLIWNEGGLNEFLDADGLETVTTLLEGIQREHEDTDSANQMKAFDIVRMVGSDSMHFINDPEIESALDVWREQDNMDDISEPSYFKQWDQSLNGSTWILDGNPQNLDPVLLTPEMLQQTDKLNILWDEQCGVLVQDQLCTLELVATGANYGVAKCQYGGVFVTKGTLAFLQRTFGAGQVGDKFRCWISFDGTRKHPWRTVVNGIESYEYKDMRAYQ
jgi:hypothetical protein